MFSLVIHGSTVQWARGTKTSPPGDVDILFWGIEHELALQKVQEWCRTIGVPGGTPIDIRKEASIPVLPGEQGAQIVLLGDKLPYRTAKGLAPILRANKDLIPKLLREAKSFTVKKESPDLSPQERDSGEIAFFTALEKGPWKTLTKADFDPRDWPLIEFLQKVKRFHLPLLPRSIYEQDMERKSKAIENELEYMREQEKKGKKYQLASTYCPRCGNTPCMSWDPERYCWAPYTR